MARAVPAWEFPASEGSMKAPADRRGRAGSMGRKYGMAEACAAKAMSPAASIILITPPFCRFIMVFTFITSS
jgi:hypothetical protein